MRQTGLYALRVAGTPLPVGLLVTDEDFPELNTADELIQPLIYLTTSAERRALLDAQVPKRAVDEFWLKVAGGNQTQARQLIRTYYGRVAAANQLFTAHKAGWMTDRGMLYIVLGAPKPFIGQLVKSTGCTGAPRTAAPRIRSGTNPVPLPPNTMNWCAGRSMKCCGMPPLSNGEKE
ncbi:GWxTD domain-containing protein [Hymenobacter cellulosilyticus]|uniref:GWxTD domain-containing protein n=1 Tax=Hymenobacter cellulosilyticus TaxID=2932248 RepID=A0A8T9Q8B5_9BACT|nr:GWxTD domain-containing protein [Hymenobacter cellulosilyticus]UOQ72318.1 GWxTD domain-containing protein [Hymenobacter cellulosilyticus]